jgi:hypothetical protein
MRFAPANMVNFRTAVSKVWQTSFGKWDVLRQMRALAGGEILIERIVQYLVNLGPDNAMAS